MNIRKSLSESLTEPERSFIRRLRFDEYVQKFVQKQWLEWTIALENEERLERDLVAASDCKEIARTV